MRRRFCILATVLAFASVEGQAAYSARTRVIRGVVYDATLHVPMAGAVVQAVLLDSSWSPVRVDGDMVVFSTIADTAGRYSLATLPRGRFAIGVEHEAWRSLGIPAPINAIDLTADSTVVLNLGVPSASELLLLICPRGVGEGALVGKIINDKDDEPLSGTAIVVTWTELVVSEERLVPVLRKLSATSSDDGTYRVCNVPLSAPVHVSVSREGFRNVRGDVILSDPRALRADFALGAWLTSTSTASIRALVVSSDGQPLSARIAVAALKREAASEDGTFVFPSVPRGTWMLAVQAIGYLPVTVPVRAQDGIAQPMRIIMARHAQLLDTARVVGNDGRTASILEALRTRAATAAGTTFLPGNSWLVGATQPVDIFRAARGFTFKDPIHLEARQYVGRTGKRYTCRTIASDERRYADEKELVVYLDGAKYSEGVDILNHQLKVDQILAVEAYPDVVSAPAIWRNGYTCGVIAIWTRR